MPKTTSDRNRLIAELYRHLRYEAGYSVERTIETIRESGYGYLSYGRVMWIAKHFSREDGTPKRV